MTDEPPSGLLLINPQSTLLDADGSLWRLFHPSGFGGKYWAGSRPGQRFHDLMEQAGYSLDQRRRKQLYTEATQIIHDVSSAFRGEFPVCTEWSNRCPYSWLWFSRPVWYKLGLWVAVHPSQRSTETMPSFPFIPEKFLDVVDYMLRQVGPCTRMKLVKLLYLADRYHLVRHGTPVLGDRYYRLPWGPVPSRSLDVLEAAADVAAHDPEAPADALSERLLTRIDIKDPASKYASYSSRELPGQPEYLSRSETEALEAVAKKFGGWTAVDLSELTHQHQAFVRTKPQDEIDYRLFFLDEPGVKPEAVDYLELAEHDHDLLSRL